jgi:hypothetical protein
MRGREVAEQPLLYQYISQSGLRRIGQNSGPDPKLDQAQVRLGFEPGPCTTLYTEQLYSACVTFKR